MFSSREINETSCPSFVHQAWTHVVVMIGAMDTQNRIILIVFNVILVFSTLFLNLLSITAIRKSSQLKNKLCYFVILVQSSTDCSFGVISIPAFIIFVASPLLGIESCLLVVALVQTALVLPAISIITLSSMTLERYIGVLHPYFYERSLTKQRVLFYVGLGSSVFLVIMIASTFLEGLFKNFAGFYVVGNFLFITFAYTRIYLVVRRLSLSETRPVDIEEQSSITGRRRLLREVKHAKSCFTVVVYFVISTLPCVIGLSFVDESNLRKSALMISWAITLTNLNSNFNSLIFFWTKTLLRKEAIATIKSIMSSFQWSREKISREFEVQSIPTTHPNRSGPNISIDVRKQELHES